MPRTIRQNAELVLARERVPYTLYRVAGRRHVHLQVGDDGELQVRAPWRYSLAEAEAVIRHHARWVRRSLAAAHEIQRRRPPLVTGTELPLVDDRLQLQVRRARPVGVTRRGDLLRVHAEGEDPENIRALLEGWYRAQARRYLPPRLDAFAARIGLSPRRVTVRAQRTRWGSCSSRGSISLNWRLMLLPSELVDYVLVHELCHLRYMDHSPGFWALVGTLIPDAQACHRRLRAVPSAMSL